MSGGGTGNTVGSNAARSLGSPRSGVSAQPDVSIKVWQRVSQATAESPLPTAANELPLSTSGGDRFRPVDKERVDRACQ